MDEKVELLKSAFHVTSTTVDLDIAEDIIQQFSDTSYHAIWYRNLLMRVYNKLKAHKLRYKVEDTTYLAMTEAVKQALIESL